MMNLLQWDTCCCSLQEQQGPEGSALALMQPPPPAGQQEPEGSALALLLPSPSPGQQGDGAGLGQEVAALKGLLQRVAPQLDELADLKQQMGRLMSALEPGKLHHGSSW